MNKTTTQRVRQSIVSLLIGRPLAAVCGLLILIILSRRLSVQEYGFYFAIWAMIEIFIHISNAGSLHAVYRYVSAEETKNGTVIPKGPISYLLIWRVVSLFIASGFILLIPGVAQRIFNLGILHDGFLLYLVALIVLFEGCSRFIESIFESMLCQRLALITTTVRSLVRLIGFILVVSNEDVAIGQVIIVEAVAACLGFALGSYLFWNILCAAKRNSEQRKASRESAREIAQFAMPAFMAQVISMSYGTDVLKLILLSTSGPAALAIFGFAYSFAAIIQRYLPINFLAGIIRPVFVSAYEKGRSELFITQLTSSTIRINLLFILAVLCFVWIGGRSLLASLSGDAYTAAGPVLTVLVIGSVLMSIHMTFSIYCLAKATSSPLLVSAMLSTVSLPIAYILSEKYGAMGLAFAFVISESVWCSVCFLLLYRRTEGLIRKAWDGCSRLVILAAVSILLSTLLNNEGLDWRLAAPLCTAIFLISTAFILPVSGMERAWIASLIPQRNASKNRR